MGIDLSEVSSDLICEVGLERGDDVVDANSDDDPF